MSKPTVKELEELLKAKKVPQPAGNDYSKMLADKFRLSQQYAEKGDDFKRTIADSLSPGGVSTAYKKGDVASFDKNASREAVIARAQIINYLRGTGLYNTPEYAYDRGKVFMSGTGYLSDELGSLNSKLEAWKREQDNLYSKNKANFPEYESAKAKAAEWRNYFGIAGYDTEQSLDNMLKAEAIHNGSARSVRDFDLMDDETFDAEYAALENWYKGLDPYALTKDPELPQLATSDDGGLSAQISVIQDELTRRNEFEALRENIHSDPNFEALSVYDGHEHAEGSLAAKNPDAFDHYYDQLYFINNPVLPEGYKNKYSQDWVEHYQRFGYDLMTPEEVKEYTYLVEENRMDEAARYIELLQPELNARKADIENAERTVRAQHLGYGALDSIGTVVTNPLAAVSTAAGAVFGIDDPNHPIYSLQRGNTTTRSVYGQTLGELAPSAKLFDQNVITMGYNVLMSLGDMAMARGIGGGLSKAAGGGSNFAKNAMQFIMSTESAASTYLDDLNRGWGHDQAIIHGLANGLIEAWTERGFMDSLFSGGGTFLSRVMKSGIAEGWEEIESGGLQLISDALIAKMGDDPSQVEEVYNAFASAMSESEAARNTFLYFANQLASDGLSGFASGGLMQAGTTAVQNNQYRGIGKAVTKDGDLEGVLRIADSYTNKQDVVDAVKKIRDKQARGIKAINRDVGELVTAVSNAIGEKNAGAVNGVLDSSIFDRLTELGEEVDNAKKLAPAIRKIYQGKKLTLTERASLKWSDAASEVVKEMSTNAQEEVGKHTAGRKWMSATKDVVKAVQHDAAAEAANLKEALTQKHSTATAVGAAAEKARDLMKGKPKMGTRELKAITADGEEVSGTFALVEKKNDTFTVVMKDPAGNKVEVDADKITNGGDEGILTIINYAMEGARHAMSAAEVNTMVNAYLQEGGKVDTFVQQFRDNYLAGYSGINAPAGTISDGVASIAYEQGKAEAVKDEADRVARAQKARKVENPSVGWLGDVTSDTSIKGLGDTGGLDEAMKNMTDTQQSMVEFGRHLAKYAKINVVFFASKAGADGKYTTQNGSYDPNTHTIYLDINSGASTESGRQELMKSGTLGAAIGRVAGHELTHVLEATSPEYYGKYKQAVKAALNAKSLDYASLVREKINAALANGEKLTYAGAEAEVIADASEYMLQDSKFVKNMDQGLKGKVKEVVQNFLNKVNEAFRALTGGHIESAALRTMTDGVAHYEKRLQDLWDMAFDEMLGAEVRTDSPATEETGETKTVQKSIRERDAAYMAAVERGDMVAAQKMSDAAAKEAGYTIIGYHGTKGPTLRYDADGLGEETDYQNKRLPFTVFKPNPASGIYAASNRAVADGFKTGYFGMATGTTYKLYVKFDNPFVANEHVWTSVPYYDVIPTPTEMKKAGYASNTVATEEIAQYAKSAGYDGVIIEGIKEGFDTQTNDYIAFSPEQVKLADPVTYDDSGKVIPLSERFNAANEDIRYSHRDDGSAYQSEAMTVADGMQDTDGKRMFSLRSFNEDYDTYRAMLMNHNVPLNEINDLFDTIDEIMKAIEKDREILDFGWNVGREDRSFNPVKPNSDPLYEVSLDFSTLCRKRLLQQTVQERLEAMYDTVLTKAERVAIRNELMKLREEGKQIEVACALCYVESTRLKSPAQIQRFFDDRRAVMVDYFSKKNKAYMKEVNAKADELIVKFGHEPGTKKKELNSFQKKAVENLKQSMYKQYKPSAEEEAIIATALALPGESFKTDMGLWNLKKEHEEIFDAYTSFVRNATKSKGIEGDEAWWAGDSKSISDKLIEKMNKENGLRTQSWSDFQVIHLLDYISAIIELSTRGAKMQSYTKVPDFVKLMGDTGVMINLSLIPKGFDGTLDYDPIEGMPIEEALALREMFPNTAGTICIGITDKHIRMLLSDPNTDYVIPYHSSSLDKKTRQQMGMKVWEDFQSYQNEKNKDYPNTVDDNKTYRKKPLFSEWFDYNTVSERAKVVGAERAMQEAADRYIELCHRRGLQEKFAQFAAEPNYWKLLIDRKMINQQTGEIIKQESVQPRFNKGRILDILSAEVNRFKAQNADKDAAVEHIVNAWENGEIRKAAKSKKVRDQVSAFNDTVTVANIVASAAELDAQEQAQKSIRDLPEDTVTYRDYLTEADSSIAATIEERNALSIYQKLLKNHAEASEKVIEAETALAAADEAHKPEARKTLAAARVKQKDLYNRLLNVERQAHVQTLVKRSNQIIGDLYGKNQAELDKMLADKERRIASLKADLTGLKGAARTQREADIREQEREVAALKSKATKALLANSERYQKQIDEIRLRRDINIEIGKRTRHIKRIVKRLNDRIIHEEDYKNVKEPLKPVVHKLVQTFIDGFGNMVFDAKTAGKLKSVYDMLKQEDETAEYFDEEVSDWLTTLAELARQDEARRTSGSTLENLNDKLYIYTTLSDIVDHVAHMVTAADTMFIEGKKAEASAVTEEVGNTLAAKKDRRELAGWAGKLARFADNLIVKGNMMPQFFFEGLNNKGMMRLYDDLQSGVRKYSERMLVGDEFLSDAMRRHGYHTWGGMKKPVSFKTKQGHTIYLTRENMMWIYATAKREASNPMMDTHHLDEGGITYEEIPTEKGRQIEGKGVHHLIVAEDVAEITKMLTAEQIAYVDECVEFLSTECAEWGNEASLKLFGIKKYKEGYYFPFKVDSGQLHKNSAAGATSTVSDARVKHISFSHSIKKGANTPLVMGNFTSVITDHINQMATYSGMVVPIENMSRVLNRKVDDGHENVNIRSLIARKYGDNTARYIDDLLKDLNGGPQTDNRGSLDAGLRLFKRNAVVGKLSVALQQPTAVTRAFAYISPKWFANLHLERPKHTWERMMKYSSTTFLKDMGGFNVGMGKGASNWLERGDLGDYRVYKRAKFLLDQRSLKDAVGEWNDCLTGLPGFMDKITWCAIWNATENEQAHQHPGMDRNSDEFLELVGRRFDGIVNHTQVYDSILSKSQNMRSKNAIAKMATSFMAESTLNMNLAYRAIASKDGKQIAKVTASLLLNAILGAAAYALIGAFNKDDDDRTLEEKYATAFAGRLADNLNPLASIPYLSDLWNKLQGYDVERTDLSFLFDLIEDGGKFWNKMTDPEEVLSYRDYENFVGGLISTTTGIPAKNWMGDARRIWNMTHTSTADAPFSSVWYGILDEVAPGRDSSKNSYYERYLSALRDGDKQEQYDMKEYLTKTKGTKEEDITEGVRNAYKDEYKRGGIDKQTAIKFLLDNNLVSGETADKKKQKAFQFVDKWDEGTDGYSAYNTLESAFADGNNAKIQQAWNELTSNGYSNEQVGSQARSCIKALVESGTIAPSKATELLRKWYPYKNDKDNINKPKEWAE